MTPSADAIDKLMSYGIRDWLVTDAEELAIIGVLQSDTTPDRTVADLVSAARLDPLLQRVSSDRRQLVELLGGRISTTTGGTIKGSIAKHGGELSWRFTISNEFTTI